MCEVVDVAQSEGGVAVTCLVAGNFPASPVSLRCAFVLDSGEITHLAIR
jgi:hypothetical protein